MIKHSRKIRLPPDLYSRNTFISLLVQHLLDRRPAIERHSSLEILDIGGRDSKLAWFLPQHTRLTILDQQSPPVDGKTTYVQGNACRLPFADQSFDLVVSIDLLPDLSTEEREKAVSEMLRVSRRHVIIAAPFQSVYTQTAHQLLRQYQQGWPVKQELHFPESLPDLDALEPYLGRHGVAYHKLGEGHLYHWYLQQLFALVAKQDLSIASTQPLNKSPITHANPVQPVPALSFPEFFNDHLFDLGHFRPPHYRTVLFCDKQEVPARQDLQELIANHNNFHTSTCLDMYGRALLELPQSLLTGSRQAINLLHSQMHEIQAVISEKQADKAELGQRVFVLEEEKKHWSAQTALHLQTVTLQETQLRSQDLLLGRLKTELEHSQKNERELINFIQLKEQALHEHRQQLTQNAEQFVALQNSLTQTQSDLNSIINSSTWRLIRSAQKVGAALYHPLRQSWQYVNKKLVHMGGAGKKSHLNLTGKSAGPKSPTNAYQEYLEGLQLSERDMEKLKISLRQLNYQPLFSIIVPVGAQTSLAQISGSLQSIKNQYYGKWEICLVIDPGVVAEIRAEIERQALSDTRWHLQYRTQNGDTAKFYNTALRACRGGYVTLLQPGHLLAPTAFQEVVTALQSHRYDLIYTDHDELDGAGTHINPFFKPDFDLDMLLAFDYIGSATVFRRKVISELGGYSGNGVAVTYDLLLRLTDKPRSIHHIPQVLYHTLPAPATAAVHVHTTETISQYQKALQDSIRRRHLQATVSDGLWPGSFRVQRAIHGSPMISIIIPFRDRVDLLRICLDSIFAKTTWENYEILLVNNSSELLETRDYMKEIEHCPRVRLLHYNAPFNFSAINNFAATSARGEYLLLLNNDTEIIEPDWLQNMLEHAQRPEVGVVGAKLLYRNNLVQHAGILVGGADLVNHCYGHLPAHQSGYFGQLNLVKSYSAVSSACFMVRKAVYEEMDGFDEENLAVTLHDVDFCLRLREKGYLVIYTPYATLYHQGISSLRAQPAPQEEYFLRRRHQNIFQQGDPFSNPHLYIEELGASLGVLTPSPPNH